MKEERKKKELHKKEKRKHPTAKGKRAKKEERKNPIDSKKNEERWKIQQRMMPATAVVNSFFVRPSCACLHFCFFCWQPLCHVKPSFLSFACGIGPVVPKYWCLRQIVGATCGVNASNPCANVKHPVFRHVGPDINAKYIIDPQHNPCANVNASRRLCSRLNVPVRTYFGIFHVEFLTCQKSLVCHMDLGTLVNLQRRKY